MKTVFVSSTFRDFQQERDVLRSRVLPELNRSARVYGESVDFCDLRWGVDTSSDKDEAESSKTVLSVCLNEIDRSRPYMLVMLGERYGYVPGTEAIQREAARRSLTLEDLEISVTALEIEYGALQNQEELSSTFFYFRELDGNSLPPEYLAESAIHAQKLAALKERVNRLSPGHVRFYKACWDDNRVTGLDTFAEAVSRDIQTMLQAEWNEYAKLDPYQRDSRSQWNYIEEKAKVFCTREKIADESLSELTAGPVKPLLVTGAAGNGKSTLFSQVCLSMQKQGWTVLPFACGNTILSTDAFGILKSEVWQLEELTCQSHFEEEEKAQKDRDKMVPFQNSKEKSGEEKWRERLEELCGIFARSGGKLLLAVDAVDQLRADEMRDRLQFLPHNLTENVRILCTCLNTFRLPGDTRSLPLTAMDAKECLAVAEGILKQSGKQLDQAVKASLLKKQEAGNPLFLYLAITRLTLMNSDDFQQIRRLGNDMAAITAQQLALVEQMPGGVEAMGVALLSEVSLRVGLKMAAGAAEYLAVSRRGLRTEDLDSLLTDDGAEFSALKFAQFVNFMNELFLLRSDGRYDFLHKSLRAGLLARCKDEKAVHARILTYLRALSPDDPVRIREITYHCLQAGEWDFLAAYLGTIETEDIQDAVNSAGEDLREFAEEDSGVRLDGFLKWAGETVEEEEKLRHLLEFFLWDLYPDQSNETQKQCAARLHVMLAMLKTAERCAKAFPTEKSRQYLAISYEKVGNAYEAMGSDENLQKALEVYEKDMELAEELAGELGTAYSRRNLAVSYSRVGGIYHVLGSVKNLQKALEFYEKTLVLFTELDKELGTADSRNDLSIGYQRIGYVYEKLNGTENLQKALEFCEKNMELSKKLDQELGTVNSRYNLSISYSRVGSIYEKLGGTKNQQKALKLYQKDCELAEELAGKMSTAKSRHNLAGSYQEVGRLYLAMGGKENFQKALEFCQKDMELAEELARELDTADSRYSLSNSYSKVESIYLAMGGKENFQKALEFCQKDMELSEQLVREMGNTDSRLSLVASYSKAGEIYEAIGGDENRQKALEFYQKDMELSEQVDRELGTAESRHNLSVCYVNVGGILEAMGGDENLHKAFELYGKDMELCEQLDRELSTTMSRQLVFISYSRIGGIYETMGSSEDLQKALHFYEKALELSKQLYRELGTAESEMHRAVMYKKMGGIFEKMSYKKPFGLSETLKSVRYYTKALKAQKRMIKGGKI